MVAVGIDNQYLMETKGESALAHCKFDFPLPLKGRIVPSFRRPLRVKYCRLDAVMRLGAK